jgi:hypothetical protein
MQASATPPLYPSIQANGVGDGFPAVPGPASAAARRYSSRGAAASPCPRWNAGFRALAHGCRGEWTRTLYGPGLRTLARWGAVEWTRTDA